MTLPVKLPTKVVAVATPALPNWILLPILRLPAVILFDAVIDILFVAYDKKRIFNEIRVPIEEDSVWAFKNKDEVGFYALAKVTGEKSRPCKRYEYKGYNPQYGFRISIDKLTNEHEIISIGHRNPQGLYYIKNLDIIIHCAGTGTVGSSNKEPLLKNYITTKSLIKFCKSIKEKPKIIFLSSYSIYGEKYNRPIKEYFKTNPKSCYSKTKKKSEDALIKLKNSHKINIKILRLASIYGNGIEKQLLFDVCKKIQNKSGNFYGTGDEVRDWMHISDLGSLILKIIRVNDRKNTIINQKVIQLWVSWQYLTLLL